MRLRQLNAGLSLITTIFFFNHSIYFSIWMLSRCSIEKSPDIMQQILTFLMVLHAVLSILLAVFGHKGTEKRKCKSYPKMNMPTYLQRISGILMILLLGLHIVGAMNHFQPKMLHAIMHPLFFAVALAHVAVSAEKALITLGIGNAKVIRIVNIAMKVLCVAIFAAAVAGFYLCLFVGVTR